jgi:hypothetical protein
LKKYLALLFPLILATPVAWGDILVVNDQKLETKDGTIHIIGEIQNNLRVPVNQIDIKVTLYSNGSPIDTVTTNSFVNTIMPGMKGPFEIVVFNKNTQFVDNYSLEINYQISEPKNQVIDVTSSKFIRDNFNNLIVTGTVANRGDLTANTISVVATLYDRNGNVAAVSKTHVEPDYLRSHDEMFFLVSIPAKQSNSIVDYNIIAESEEYAAVPEFPFGSLVLLASSVSAYIVLTKYSSRFIVNLVSASSPK